MLPLRLLLALLALLPVVAAVFPGSVFAAADNAAGAPRDARIKVNREDLAAPIRERGEVRVIVELQPSRGFATSANAAEARAREQDVRDVQHRLLSRLSSLRIRNVKMFRLHHFAAMTIDRAALDALEADPEVISIAEDRPVYPVLNDTPGITRADKAWLEGFRGAGQAVAIIDSGVDTAHPFFAGKIIAEACFSTAAGAAYTSYCPNPDPPDTQFSGTHQIGPGAGINCPDLALACWHGTHVAGIAAGKTGVLSVSAGGMAPDASIIPVQVFQRDCSNPGCAILAFESDLVSALEYVYSLRGTYNIASVNMSLGGGLYTATCDSDAPAMASVIASLQSAGIATVIASGNNGNANAISFPGCISSAISVGSTTKSKTISNFSNSASFLSLLAPGSSIVSSVPRGGFGTASGTSMATPHVAGAWALLKSAKPAATVSEVLAALQNSGLPITDGRNGITKSLIQLGYDATMLGALGTLLGHGNIAPLANIAASPGSGSVGTIFHLDGGASSDSDGGIVSYAWNFGDGTSATGASVNKSYATAGTYTVTLTVTDNLGATGSRTTTVTVTSVNVASAANGGVASASSSYSGGNVTYPPSRAIDGDRKGLNWGAGGGWNDATPNNFPDWIQVTFSATQSIGEIDVFTVQDNYQAPLEPTSSMTFTKYGITSFQVQYWNGAWTDVPGGNVTGNNLVWRKFTFTPVTTDRIRVLVNGAVDLWSRIAEIEAWTAAGTTNIPPTVSLTSPANGATFTAPATVSLAATAADPDGTVSRVDFYRGATLIGSDTSAAYTWSDTGLAAGTYSYTAVAYDNAGASTSSATATVTVTTAGATSVNVASAANGGVATASSSYSGGNVTYPPSRAIDGDRKGLNWGAGGGWNDATPNSFPDSIEVTFSATQSIGEIDVFTVQDNYQAPLEPTSSMTFTKYGITSFQVQYWNGAWTDVPGGNVTGNNLVWRKFTFTPVTTDRIRVLVNGAVDLWSRIAEIEAWTAAGTTNIPPTVSLTSPANGATFTAPATVSLAAAAADSNGTVSRVDFYRGATLIGSDTSAAYTWSDTGLAAGTYSYTAVAYDNAGASTSSATATVTVTTAGATSVNVASAANGGVASASSSYSGGNVTYPPSRAIDGDRKGLNWGAGGGWNDATPNNFPDWIQVTFSATQSIGEIDVFTVQDNYQAPLEPTSSMTFTKYGITSFQVQYWNGAWTDVPGGNVTGNNLVWRKFTFTPVTTDRIRVLVNGAVDLWSRIAEIEAWTP